MTKAAVNEIWGILFSLINMVVWLEGGQGEVKGACDGPTLGLGGMYPPNCPTCTPPPPNQPSRTPAPQGKSPPPLAPCRNPPPSPPQGASGQRLVGGGSGVQN